jgi:hypothetical protein
VNSSCHEVKGIQEEGGHPLKGKSREKTHLHEKNALFFLAPIFVYQHGLV